MRHFIWRYGGFDNFCKYGNRKHFILVDIERNKKTRFIEDPSEAKIGELICEFYDEANFMSITHAVCVPEDAVSINELKYCVERWKLKWQKIPGGPYFVYSDKPCARISLQKKEIAKELKHKFKSMNDDNLLAVYICRLVGNLEDINLLGFDFDDDGKLSDEDMYIAVKAKLFYEIRSGNFDRIDPDGFIYLLKYYGGNMELMWFGNLMLNN